MRLYDELNALGGRLNTLADRIDTSIRRPTELDTGLGDAIGSTIELGEVLRRTLAATGALAGVDGAEVDVMT